MCRSMLSAMNRRGVWPLAGPRQSEIPNAGLNRVRIEGDRIDILTWADTQHLADLPAQPTYDQTRLAPLDV